MDDDRRARLRAILDSWGSLPRGEQTLLCGDPQQGPLVPLGFVTAIAYAPMRRGDRHVIREHEFAADPPLLCYGRAGRLILAGGSYVVGPLGIVDAP